MTKILKSGVVVFGWTFALTLITVSQAWASGAGGPIMPWNGPLQNLLDNLSGTTAQVLGMLMFVIGALMWGFSRNEEHIRRFGGAVFGCAIAIGVVSLFNALAFQGALL
jgi:type IV secretory pathway VirB2 component (pilin)